METSTTQEQLQKFITEGKEVIIQTLLSKKVSLRYNKDKKSEKDAWRVFINDKMYLTSKVIFETKVVSTETIFDMDSNEQKFNVCALADLVLFKNNIAYVR